MGQQAEPSADIRQTDFNGEEQEVGKTYFREKDEEIPIFVSNAHKAVEKRRIKRRFTSLQKRMQRNLLIV